ncbi:MAG: trypsin-like peptidase domain-containing protein [Planctomycetales bacterium]|nr:trypsin-like peptidase domain-containing protein [Planctomycetales bacterium]
MLCALNRLQQLACWLSVLLTMGSAAHAQIQLRPSTDMNILPGQYDSSRRTKPVSREIPAPVDLTVREAVEDAYSSRDQEFLDLQREADFVERQLNLLRRIVRFASPTIVHIEATKRAEAGKGFASSRVEEAGAGVVVSILGRPYILTNRHVVHPADISSIRIEFANGQQIRPSGVLTDPSTDVALLQLSETNLLTAKLGNSEQMHVGDFVLAVGSPFGLSHSVTYGILSAKGRRNLELGSKEIEIQDFFQTDAAINPGNSGGPLLNLRGEIIGINTAIASNSGGNEGIGFSIPINMAMSVAEQLVSRGQLERAYLGVQLENAFDILTARRLGLRTASGALVKSIIPGSPAEKAGIRVGDVIVEFDGNKIENDGHLVQSVGLTPTGKLIPLTLFRNAAPLRVSVMLESNPE